MRGTPAWVRALLFVAAAHLLGTVGAARVGAPADDLLQELDSVEESLERSEASAQRAEEIRAGVCGSRISGLQKDVSNVEALISGVIPPPKNTTRPDEVAQQVAAINKTADRRILEKKQRELTAEVASQREMYDAVQKGFSGDNAAFALAANARAVAQELQAAHAARYDSYSRTLESMLSLIEGHFAGGSANAEASVSDSSEAAGNLGRASEEVQKTAAVASSASFLEADAQEAPSNDLEWQSSQAQQLYARIAIVVKNFDAHQAMERAMEKESLEAWQNAAGQREQEYKESMKLLHRLEHSMKIAEQRLNAIERQLKPEEPEKPSSVPVAVVRMLPPDASMKRQEKHLEALKSELALWTSNCESHAQTYLGSRTRRQEMLRKIRSAKSMILNKVVRAKAVTDSTSLDALSVEPTH